MSDIESATYSETAGGNNAASPNGAPEGMAPSGVNDTIREIMAAIKRDWNCSHPTVTSGGAANAQTLTYATAPAGYFQGQRFCFIAGFTNTGTATLNVNGLGTKNIFMDGVALIGGEIGALMMSFNTGTGTEQKGSGTFTGAVTVATVTANLGTSSAVTTIKAVSTVVVPTSATQGEIDIVFTPVGTAGANDYVEIDEVQIEIGGLATAFDRRPFADELARCQRFYWKSFAYAIAPATGVATGNLNVIQPSPASTGLGGTTFMLPTRMRTAGSGILYNPSAANAQIRNVTVGADCSGSNIQVTDAFFRIVGTSAPGSNPGSANEVHATIDADL